MKYCEKCGKELPDNARFCGSCGAQLKEEKLQEKSEEKQEEKSGEKSKDKPVGKKKKVGFIIGIAVILLAILVGGLIVMNGKKKEKEYDQYISMADKYLEEFDYEQAEAAFLDAIEIDKKQLKPYVELAKIYIKQEDYDKADEIIEDAEEAGATGDEDVEDEVDIIKDIITNKDGYVDYKWILEASIDADRMYYLQSNCISSEQTTNESHRQYYTPYAVIQRGDLLGLIDMEGNMLAELEYSDIFMYGEMCMLDRAEPINVGQYQDWTQFRLNNGRIEPIDGLGGPGPGIYYYYNGLQAYWDIFGTLLTTSVTSLAFPIQQASSLNDETMAWWDEVEAGKYAVYYKDRLITDFIYDKCGTSADGLIAVCQDGKWGYINTEGEIVIPLNYDASWDRYGRAINSDGSATYSEFCYGASDGFLVLCRDGAYQLCDLTGKVVIPEGRFEEILPVYEGKCWVKDNGKWGVIEVAHREEKKEEKVDVKVNQMSQSDFDALMSDVSWFVEALGEMHTYEDGIGASVELDEGTVVPYYDENGNLYAADFYPDKSVYPEGTGRDSYVVTYYYTTGIYGRSDLCYVNVSCNDGSEYCDRFISDNGYLLRWLKADGSILDATNAEQLKNNLPPEIVFYDLGYKIAESFPFH